MTVTTLTETSICLPSLPSTRLEITTSQIDKLTDEYGTGCGFFVTVKILAEDLERADLEPTEWTLLVMADEVIYRHKPPEMRINQVLLEQSQPRTVLVSVNAKMVNDWLMPGKWLGIRNNGRLIQELREAIAPRLVCSRWR